MDCKAALLEFFGTATFLLLGLGGIQAGAAALGNPSPDSPPSILMLMYIAMSMGLSLLISAWLFYRITGGLFNPNVSLALLLTGVIGPVRFVLYVIAQIVGGIAAAGLVRGLTGMPLASKYVTGDHTLLFLLISFSVRGCPPKHPLHKAFSSRCSSQPRWSYRS